ncbi:aminopeptidase P family protein [Thermodesulfobacterium hydrogeniphilum]|uniref:aminopeptidase P family protein n=1 Tax=Thermodesulfobacterium hydrogeniphilum TaxID=161156 RepID=UPI000570479D|nr:aminopeptidase P family protein [Thermodesulfobacterium hydrogeniphilum]
MEYKNKKLLKLKEFLEKNQLSAFLFSSSSNVFYLSKFKSTNAYIIITKNNQYFLTDARYYEKAKEEIKDYEVIQIKDNTIKFLKNFLRSLEIKTLGFEKDKVSCEFKEKLRTKGIKLKGFSRVLKDFRIIKDEEEIKIIKDGIKKTDKVYKSFLEELKKQLKKQIFLTELNLRGILVYKMFEVGASGESFPSIIASGSHSAIPHWESSYQEIKLNAPLLVDMGLIWKGYCTDFTRTLFIGKPDEEFKKMYEIVKTAWYKGFERVKRGVSIAEIDKTIREYFQEKGLAEYFIHATGHGVGVEIHEAPRIFYKNSEEGIIEDGMVFTIEPGLYFPGKYGIRLENIIIVENGRGENFSEIDLDLKVIDLL